MKHENFDIDLSPNGRHAQKSEFLDSMDFQKIKTVFSKNIIWLLLIFLSCTTAAYLYIRYTKPMYESVSDLKLDVKSEATILGFNTNQNFDDLTGEIELLKSKLFFNKVINTANIDISYHYYGAILTQERYKNSPFTVEYQLKNTAYFNKVFDLEIQDENKFQLSYAKGGSKVYNDHRFDDSIETDDFVFQIKRTPHYGPDNGVGKYYFIIHSEAALINYIQSNLNVNPINFNAKIIRISFKDQNPSKARDLVNAIDTLYLNYTRETKNKATPQQIEFLEEQLDQTEQKEIVCLPCSFKDMIARISPCHSRRLKPTP